MTLELAHLVEPPPLRDAREAAFREAAQALTALYGAETGEPLNTLADAIHAQTTLPQPQESP